MTLQLHENEAVWQSKHAIMQYLPASLRPAIQTDDNKIMEAQILPTRSLLILPVHA